MWARQRLPTHRRVFAVCGNAGRCALRSFGVHFAFVLVAILLGGAIGVSAAMWWHGLAPVWVVAMTILLGIALLVLQGLYIQQRPSTRRRVSRSGDTRPDLAAVHDPHTRP